MHRQCPCLLPGLELLLVGGEVLRLRLLLLSTTQAHEDSCNDCSSQHCCFNSYCSCIRPWHFTPGHAAATVPAAGVGGWEFNGWMRPLWWAP